MRDRTQTYHEQDGCYNCGYCFVKGDYDDPNTYYCSLDAPPRPKCLSVYMGESDYDPSDDKAFEKMYRNWLEWSDGREVEAWGKCSFWIGPVINKVRNGWFLKNTPLYKVRRFEKRNKGTPFV